MWGGGDVCHAVPPDASSAHLHLQQAFQSRTQSKTWKPVAHGSVTEGYQDLSTAHKKVEGSRMS